MKVRWPLKVNGNEDLTELNKELIKKAFDNSQSSMKDARYVFLNTPSFNKPVGDDYRTLVKAPRVYPVYGNVSQVLVFPYMTSQRLLVMEIEKVEYNGTMTVESTSYVHYDRMLQRVLSRLDILVADVEKENKLLKLINKKIDSLNKGRAENNLLQHALNVPAEVRCGKDGIMFQFKHGSISSSPIDILLEYDKLEPYLTKEFEQLQENNDGYWVYKNDILKPEPLNPSQTSANKVTKAPVVKPKAKNYNSYGNQNYGNQNYGNKNYGNQGYGKKGYGKKSYGNKDYGKKKYGKRSYGRKHYGRRGYKKSSYVMPTQTSQRKYSGARRKSGYRGYSGKRH